VFEDRTMLDPAAGPAPPEAIPAPDPNQTQRVIPGQMPAGPVAAEPTQQAISVTCGVCQTPNPPGERWCSDCGFLLGSAAAEIGDLPDASMLPRLVAASNGAREYPLQPGPNSVGRENADILLLDPEVSRVHARLTVAEQSVTVEDLGSTNGTYVAGRRLTRGEALPVYDGDEVRFGGLALRAVVPGGQPRPAEEAPAAGEGAPQERGPAVATLMGDEGQQYPLYEGLNTVGRRSENDIYLTGDPYVSGRHAEIRLEGEEIRLIDLGSTNGTFIAGERLEPRDARLVDESTVFQIGKTNLRIRRGEAGDAEAPRPAATAESAERDESPTMVVAPGETPGEPGSSSNEAGEQQS
jgi:pSer/pThr/pTyr-binding forkhead associated (FHA) protein